MFRFKNMLVVQDGMVIGSTAETVMRQADCSMLALKPDEIESPILPQTRPVAGIQVT